jgi:hypothetical protein
MTHWSYGKEQRLGSHSATFNDDGRSFCTAHRYRVRLTAVLPSPDDRVSGSPEAYHQFDPSFRHLTTLGHKSLPRATKSPLESYRSGEQDVGLSRFNPL